MLQSLDDLPTIDTERLQLVPLGLQDAPAVCAISDNPAILDAIGFLPKPFGLEQARALIRAKGDGRDRFVGAWSRAAGELLGVLGVHLQGEGRVEIGYWIAPAEHGRGYASEAAGALVALLSQIAPERRIVARAFEHNLGSRRVLAKMGFRPAAEAGLDPEPLLFALPAP